ncbi:hypothetical protein PCCS19_04230 [Paenibacillus sp. CCS19]|uniref:hypothetical protein n=1 Tax=Paenibacillus sp. CCS19 TaxID=3158387 RepID=UPI002561245F|nr:hypothetical protein [Paenibacillus cellulosilyticus]GMK37370.1 hypothetical protein PCCS19_04230 [Paenibacillus cellulosilyticus]
MTKSQLIVALRRTILIILIVLLIPHYIQKLTNDRDRGMGDTIYTLKDDGPVSKLPVHQSFKIDNDTVTVDTVYVTPKQIMVTYTYRTKQTKNVWSFPDMSLVLVMPDGQRLMSHNAGSNGTSWGSYSYVSFDLPDSMTDHADLVYDRYDRHAELQIPLSKAGDGL